MANIKICLIVDTATIAKCGAVKSCHLIDNQNSSISYDPRKTVTYVERGQMIEWSGMPQDPSSMDCISIDSISKKTKKGGQDMFGVPILIGSSGKITATVIAKGHKGEDEIYKIRFTVIENSTGKNKSYDIDPKIQVHRR